MGKWEKEYVASRGNDTDNGRVKMKKSSCRKEELERLQRRYEGRSKEGKTRMLDEFPQLMERIIELSLEARRRG